MVKYFMETPSQSPLTEIKVEDQAWFQATSRIVARRVVGRNRPDLLDDAEVEAKMSGWLAYSGGSTRATVAWAMRIGAVNLYRNEVGRLPHIDPETGKQTYTMGHRNLFNRPQTLSYTNAEGNEEERPDLPRSMGGIDTLIGHLNFEYILSLLTPRHAEILRLRYEDEMDCKEIAPRLGTSSDRVQKIIQIALAKLRLVAAPFLLEHMGGSEAYSASLLHRASKPQWIRPKPLYVPSGPDKRYARNNEAKQELYTHEGRSLSLVEWAEQPESVVDYTTLRRRIVRNNVNFWEALTAPIKVYSTSKNLAAGKRSVVAV